MTSLGKRKAGETDAASNEHGSTLFVSNLPYSATSTDLQTLFSDIAPVRSAFVVTEHGTGFSKGVGYVSFSLREDATMAFEKISEDGGMNLNGRKLSVQWAERKAPKSQREKGQDHVGRQTKHPKEEGTRRPPAVPKDPSAVKTLVVGGLPTPLDQKVLWKKVRKLPGAEKVEWPINGDVTTAHVMFSTPSQANDAISKLHAHVYKGSLLSATLKKRIEHLAVHSTSSPQTPANKKAGTTPSNASRLIVRNLPFDITDQDIRKVFLPYGPIYRITIPSKSSQDHQHPTAPPSSSGKGFAFVHFYSVKNAKDALEHANGVSVWRGMAQSMIEDKQKKKKEIRLAAAAVASKEQPMATSEPADGEDPPEQDSVSKKSRVIAVDWALSKDRWEEEKAKEDDQVSMDTEDISTQEDSEGEGDSTDVDSDDDDQQLGVHEDSPSESGSDSSESDEDDSDMSDVEEPTKPSLPATDTGTTIFIRNVPFSATDDDLRALFRSFGPLRYARITLESDTGRPRGTGFACFWNKEDADAVIEHSETIRQETLGSSSSAVQAEKEKKKNPFAMHSILTPDPSSNLAKSLVLHGRTLDVVRAVTRDEANKLREDGERRREKTDKRNTYLLREGVVFANSPAASTMQPAELTKRQASYSARKNLLRSNPSLYVSLQRLSVRQIPLYVSERVLKRLAIHAVKQFEVEVGKGQRNGLSAEELNPITSESNGADVEEEPPTTSSKSKVSKKKRQNTIKQAKIVRAQDRVDAVTGKGRSKGYGFIEMTSHADALRVLRWTNNNPAVHEVFHDSWKRELQDLIQAEKGNPKKGEDSEIRLKRYQDDLDSLSKARKSGPNLIVEFSIENVQVVKRRRELMARKNVKAVKKPAKDENDVVDDGRQREEREPEKKKRKVENKKASKATAGKPDQPVQKAGARIGSIIGRKRKQRQAAKK